MRAWIAVMRGDGTIIAYGATYGKCSAAADDTGLWDRVPGSHAPYYFTTATISDCQLCGGNGKLKEYDVTWNCPDCGGIGIIQIG